LSGNVEDPEFFDKDVKPFLGAKIRWVGPVGPEQPLSKREVADLMGRARAFLMTPNLFEPFGLVVAESMSCGTPVITFDRGGPSEIVKDGVTGFVVSPRAGVRGLAAACAKIDEIDPAACRARVEKYFTLDRMVEAYERVYRELPPK
jgi:glycosyltransferase involved in cell wall biosynthesis